MISLLGNRNISILFLTRFLRLFSYGLLSVGLFRYLSLLGFSPQEIGNLLTAILFGDLFGSFYLTIHGDSWGRKNILIVSAVLKIFAGVSFIYTDSYWFLLLVGIFGIISPSGGEIGPFLPLEQSSITECINSVEEIPKLFGFYNLIGYLAQGGGNFFAGWFLYESSQASSSSSSSSPWLFPFSSSAATVESTATPSETLEFSSLRMLFIFYSMIGFLELFFYLFLSHTIEPLHTRVLEFSPSMFWTRFGFHQRESVKIVTKLSLLFLLDSFAGGFVMQSVIVYWFQQKYGETSGVASGTGDSPATVATTSAGTINAQQLGLLLMGSNILAGVSALAATPLVKRIGAIPTMVFTHFPSNIFLLLVPFMPNVDWAMAILLIRFSISQMDVPARQAYVATVVAPDERTAASGITNIVRSIGLSISPLFLGYFLEQSPNDWLFGFPFILAGGLKCLYDILLYISFQMAQGGGNFLSQVEEKNKKNSSSATAGYQTIPTTGEEGKEENPSMIRK